MEEAEEQARLAQLPRAGLINLLECTSVSLSGPLS